MEIKLFGKSLFEVKKRTIENLFEDAVSASKESKFLPDFHESQNDDGPFAEYVEISDIVPGKPLATKKGKQNKPAKGKADIKLTPKGVHQLKLLNDEAFVLNTDTKYVDQQISDFKDKLGLIKSEEYDMRRGVNEISSIVTRLENRKKYPAFKDFYGQFPYTTTSRINGSPRHTTISSSAR
jgi:hypothetical protein